MIGIVILAVVKPFTGTIGRWCVAQNSESGLMGLGTHLRHSGIRHRSAIADLRRQVRNPYSWCGLWIPGLARKELTLQNDDLVVSDI